MGKMSKEYCCEGMEAAIEHGFLIKRDGETLINKAKHPIKAGNVLTGETYDPKEFIFTMSLTYCPFCGKRLVEEMEDEGRYYF